METNSSFTNFPTYDSFSMELDSKMDEIQLERNASLLAHKAKKLECSSGANGNETASVDVSNVDELVYHLETIDFPVYGDLSELKDTENSSKLSILNNITGNGWCDFEIVSAACGKNENSE